MALAPARNQVGVRADTEPGPEPIEMFDFDRVIERRGTHSSKWDKMAALSGIDAPDAIPMWVADMDFAAPPGVTQAGRGRSATRRAWLLCRRRKLGRGHGRMDGAPSRPQGRSGLGQPDAGHRVGARADPAGGEPAGRRGGGVSAGLSRLPPHHRVQRADNPRCAARRAERPLCHGPRRAAPEAHAAKQGRVPVQPAQPRRQRLVGRRTARARGAVHRTRPDPGLRRNPQRPRVRRTQARAHA
jgi:hypothetical protein